MTKPVLEPSAQAFEPVFTGEMIEFLWMASKGYRLRPWRSPYLLWRIETYWGWHAQNITAREFWRFVWQQRRDLARFLRWADKMNWRVE